MRLRTTFLWTMICSLGLAAVLGIFAILVENLGSTTERVLVTALIVGGFSVTGLVAAIVLEKKRLVVVAWSGIGASLLAFIGWLLIVWVADYTYRNPWEMVVRVSACFTYLSVWAPIVGVIGLPRIDRTAGRATRAATVGCLSLLMTLLVCFTFTEYDEEWFMKSMAIVTILSACGTVVTPIMALVEMVRRRTADASIQSKVRVRITCPRCGVKSILPSGGAVCTACKLRIRIEVEEPRCACGYALFGLTSATCPECGRAVPPEQLWKPADDAAV